tara:strand:+ start:402 stop:698 length:297 start_codon:yes stop_codon:yes gene_type:complete
MTAPTEMIGLLMKFFWYRIEAALGLMELPTHIAKFKAKGFDHSEMDEIVCQCPQTKEQPSSFELARMFDLKLCVKNTFVLLGSLTISLSCHRQSDLIS